MQYARDNESINEISVGLPIGILAHKADNGIVWRLGWKSEFGDEFKLVRQINFFRYRRPYENLNQGITIELYPWDKSKLINQNPLIRYQKRNKNRNVELTQTITNVNTMLPIMNSFLAHAGNFLILHCNLPKTI